MESYLKFTLLFSSLLVTVLPAPLPVPQGPFAAIGSLIQRLQSSFNEGSASVKQSNSIESFALPILSGESSTTTTITTTTTTTTTPKPTFRPTNAFDSINAILDNISRNTNNNKNENNADNNILGLGNPPRNIFDFGFSTARPTTTQPPFSLDGINQGINAFFQTFIRTNIQKLFQGPDQQQHQIAPRSDEQQSRTPSFFENIFNTLFPKRY